MIPANVGASTVRDWAFPRAATGLRVLLTYGRDHGLGARTVLAGTGLQAGSLGLASGSGAAEVTAAQELRVVRNLVARLGEGIGPDVGSRYRAETFGVFGYALRSSRTLGEAVEVALTYLDLSHAFALPRAEVVGDEVVGRLDGGGLPVDVREVLVARDATAVLTVLDDLVPGGTGASLELTGSTATLRVAVSEMARPLPRDGADAAERSRLLCEQVVEPRRRRTGLAADVRVLVTQRLPEGAPMTAVAADLGRSERTLRRELAAAGVGYRELLDEVRASLAAELLRSGPTLGVDALARRLGYAEATSFIAAFRRWTGTTPAAWAREFA
ncbi:helix-turn-helix domain-containing protein [Nocardioides nanhaiensis]|uniref:AraC family transcriptional regulator n=1 Tax=Nocardioides nanhaiensis TaxID=1476871 RepID=A0ABP8WUE9_9ACTN